MSAEERSDTRISPFGDEDEVRGSLEVTVTDTISRPISGATVRLSLGGAVAEKTTDNNGKATFSVLAYLTYRLEVEKTGYAKVSQNIQVGQGTNYVKIYLYYLVTVAVLDNTNNRPIAGATVTFNWTEDDIGKTVSGKTDSQGKVILEVPHYPEEMVVEKEGYTTYRSDSVVIDGPGKNIIVKLNPISQSPPQPSPRHNLTVTVVNYKGRPISGATVTVYRDGQRMDSKTTGQDGKANFQLEQGTYAVEAFKSGYREPARRSVTLDRDKSEQLTLHGYRLTIIVKDSRTGQPITGAAVKAIDQSTSDIVDEGTTT